jgi:hypothetical protein
MPLTEAERQLEFRRLPLAGEYPKWFELVYQRGFIQPKAATGRLKAHGKAVEVSWSGGLELSAPVDAGLHGMLRTRQQHGGCPDMHFGHTPHMP